MSLRSTISTLSLFSAILIFSFVWISYISQSAYVSAQQQSPPSIPVLELSYYPTIPCSLPGAPYQYSTLSASSNVNNSNPQGAIDGSKTSGKWAFYQEPYRDQYWQVDLGNTVSIQSMTLYFWYIDRPEQYRILASDDPSFSQFSTLVTETHGLTGYAKVDPSSAIEYRTYTFAPVTKRYVRLIIDDYRASTSPDIGQVNLYEVEISPSGQEKQCLNFSETGELPGISSTPDMSDPLSVIKTKVSTNSQQTINALTQGTKFRGYKNPQTPSYFTYNILEHKDILKALPPNPSFPIRPDYKTLMQEQNICHYVDTLGVKEVWIWAYHNASSTMAPDESNMSMGTAIQSKWNNGSMNGPVPSATYGDISNSPRINDLPTCLHTYTLYHYNYRSGAENAVHNHGHQIESLLGYGDTQLFWYNWGGKQYFEDAGSFTCGNIHFTPNASAGYTKQQSEYQYSLTNPFSTSCQNWLPNGTGIKENISCSAWGCTEMGFYTWWMQNIPGYNASIPYQSTTLSNWWNAVYDIESFLLAHTNPLIAPTSPSSPTPTITPSPTTVPTPTPTPISLPGYTGEYYSNISLSGTPKATRQDAEINFSWGKGSPIPGTIPEDYFSVRWTKTDTFASGNYLFTATADDGIRVILDGTPIINAWKDQGATTYTSQQFLSSGTHTIVIEYYEHWVGSTAIFTIQPVASTTPTITRTPTSTPTRTPTLTPSISPMITVTSTPLPPTITPTHTYTPTRTPTISPSSSFVGEYFSNKTLSGSPTHTRQDPDISFSWGRSSPVPGIIPEDGFSVRWTKTQSLPSGSYLFSLTGDDGIRLFLDGELVLNGWKDQGPTTYTTTKALSEGYHTFIIEYYENTIGATAYFSFSSAGTPTITVTPTITHTPTPTSTDTPTPTHITPTPGISSSFTGSYFSNMSLSGDPTIIRDDATINFSWRRNSPIPGIIPPDGFSVRWEKSESFRTGVYRFTMTGDDGVRLFIDNQMVLDGWKDQGPTAYAKDIAVGEGAHMIKMEYYENVIGAVAKLVYEKIQ